MSIFPSPFSKSAETADTKLVKVHVFEVILTTGERDQISADIMCVTEGGALVLYKTKWLGKAGTVRTAVRAYGVGQWKTVQQIEVLRTA